MTLVILLSGRIGVGKDVVADIMCRDLGFVRHAFADALKEDVADATGLPLHFFNDRDKKDTVLPGACVTPRDLLIAHAIAAKTADPEFYSRVILDRIKNSNQARHVISDWRFTSEEAHLIRELPDARIVRVRVERPWLLHREPGSYLDSTTFVSRIINEGTLDDLRDEVIMKIRAVTGS